MYIKNTLTGSLCSFLGKYLPLITLFLVAGNQPTHAQKKSSLPKITPVETGFKVPESLSGTSIVAGKPGTGLIRLSDYRGKLLILDFWATWCAACIHNFPVLDSLQKKSAGKMEVLLVNSSAGQTPAKIRAFFNEGLKRGEAYPFPTIITDTRIKAAFPHTLIPHYVWIGPDGTVKAITDASQLTLANVEKMAGVQQGQLELKRDFDLSKPLLLSDYPGNVNLMQYSVLFKGHITGLPSGNEFRRQGQVIYGRLITNRTLYTLFQIAFGGIYPDWSQRRFRAEVRDSSTLFLEKASIPATQWYAENLYSYDLILPVEQAALLYPSMLNDLNSSSPYYGRIEVRHMKTLGLYLDGKTAPPATKGGTPENTLVRKQDRQLVNKPVKTLLTWLNNDLLKTIETTDQTAYPGNIDLQIPDTTATLAEIRLALQPYGLELREEEHDVDCFIVSEKPTTPIVTQH